MARDVITIVIVTAGVVLIIIVIRITEVIVSILVVPGALLIVKPLIKLCHLTLVSWKINCSDMGVCDTSSNW